nr:MAG TPA: hypothetical protein [Caudoviricetes sp.]
MIYVLTIAISLINQLNQLNQNRVILKKNENISE